MPARRVDPVAFAAMYTAGASVAEMCARFGITSPTTIKNNRRALGLKPRPPGNPKRGRKVYKRCRRRSGPKLICTPG